MEFEEIIQKIDELNRQLSDENLPLNKSVELYKEGAKLILDARKMLQNAQLQIKEIENISEENGGE